MSKLQGCSMWLYVTVALWTVIIFGIASIAGCGPETTAGGIGLASGFAASKTVAGIEADLARQEQELIAKYNRMVEAGESADTLAEVRRDIEKMVLVRQTTSAAKDVMATDWSDPAKAGGAVGLILTTLYGWTKRKELANTVAGVKSFRANADEGVKHQLDQIMQDKRAAI